MNGEDDCSSRVWPSMRSIMNMTLLAETPRGSSTAGHHSCRDSPRTGTVPRDASPRRDAASACSLLLRCAMASSQAMLAASCRNSAPPPLLSNRAAAPVCAMTLRSDTCLAGESEETDGELKVSTKTATSSAPLARAAGRCPQAASRPSSLFRGENWTGRAAGS